MIAANQERWSAVMSSFARRTATCSWATRRSAGPGSSGDWSAASAAGLVNDTDALFVDTGVRWAAAEDEEPTVATLTDRVGT